MEQAPRVRRNLFGRPARPSDNLRRAADVPLGGGGLDSAWLPPTRCQCAPRFSPETTPAKSSWSNSSPQPVTPSTSSVNDLWSVPSALPRVPVETQSIAEEPWSGSLTIPSRLPGQPHSSIPLSTFKQPPHLGTPLKSSSTVGSPGSTAAFNPWNGSRARSADRGSASLDGGMSCSSTPSSASNQRPARGLLPPRSVHGNLSPPSAPLLGRLPPPLSPTASSPPVPEKAHPHHHREGWVTSTADMLDGAGFHQQPVQLVKQAPLITLEAVGPSAIPRLDLGLLPIPPFYGDRTVHVDQHNLNRMVANRRHNRAKGLSDQLQRAREAVSAEGRLLREFAQNTSGGQEALDDFKALTEKNQASWESLASEVWGEEAEVDLTESHHLEECLRHQLRHLEKTHQAGNHMQASDGNNLREPHIHDMQSCILDVEAQRDALEMKALQTETVLESRMQEMAANQIESHRNWEQYVQNLDQDRRKSRQNWEHHVVSLQRERDDAVATAYRIDREWGGCVRDLEVQRDAMLQRQRESEAELEARAQEDLLLMATDRRKWEQHAQELEQVVDGSVVEGLQAKEEWAERVRNLEAQHRSLLESRRRSREVLESRVEQQATSMAAERAKWEEQAHTLAQFVEGATAQKSYAEEELQKLHSLEVEHNALTERQRQSRLELELRSEQEVSSVAVERAKWEEHAHTLKQAVDDSVARKARDDEDWEERVHNLEAEHAVLVERRLQSKEMWEEAMASRPNDAVADESVNQFITPGDMHSDNESDIEFVNLLSPDVSPKTSQISMLSVDLTDCRSKSIDGIDKDFGEESDYEVNLLGPSSDSDNAGMDDAKGGLQLEGTRVVAEDTEGDSVHSIGSSTGQPPSQSPQLNGRGPSQMSRRNIVSAARGSRGSTGSNEDDEVVPPALLRPSLRQPSRATRFLAAQVGGRPADERESKLNSGAGVPGIARLNLEGLQGYCQEQAVGPVDLSTE